MSNSVKPWIVYAFAGFYLVVLTWAWLGADPAKIQNGDFFAQSALILAAVGLYNANPPSN